MKVTRRSALALVAMTGFVWQFALAFASDKLRLGKSIASSFLFCCANNTKTKGIFAPNRIDAEISVIRFDGQMQQALAAGLIDVGFEAGTGMAKGAAALPSLPLPENPNYVPVRHEKWPCPQSTTS